MENYHFLDGSIGYGNFVDYYDPEKPQINDPKNKPSFDFTAYNEINRKKRFRRLVDSNVSTYPKPKNPFNIRTAPHFPPVLLTLTYDRPLSDIHKGKEDLNLFMRRLNYSFDNPDLKYLAVPEKTKNDRVHFHNLFFNLPFAPKQLFQDAWGNGFIDVRRIDRVRSMGRYMTKYLTKSTDREKHQKSFISSKDLKKPVVIYNQEIADEITNNLKNYQIISKNSYHSIWEGKVNYTCYKLQAPLDLPSGNDKIKT